MASEVFHLSIGVKSLEESIEFFRECFGSRLMHQEMSYANIDFFGNQITLKPDVKISSETKHFHFGINLSLDDFEKMRTRLLESKFQLSVSKVKCVDENTPLERKKMYVTSPSGYLIEIKGY